MQEEAVEILACVIADPISARVTTSMGMVSIGTMAAEVLARLEDEIDPIPFASAQARGTAKSVEVGAKELLVASP
jgi:hypothetical protein